MLHFSYSPRIGGVEIVIDQMAAVLRRHGHEVLLLQSPDDPAVASLDALLVHNVLTMPFSIDWTVRLWKLASERGPRIIAMTHDIAADNVDYAHIDYRSEPWSLLRTAHPNVTYVTISERRREQFLALTGCDIPVLPMGTDVIGALSLTDNVQELVTDEALFSRDLVLLHPTRMVRRKNIELGIRLVAALRDSHVAATLLITGAPDWHNADSAAYAQELSTLRKDLGVEAEALFLHERFRVESADLHALYRLADALFFPSRQEGFGLPLIEAPLHRIPVFCSNVEPLSSLAPSDAVKFSPDIPSIELAAQMIACMKGRPEIQNRKRILKEHGWDAIYEKSLAPLLRIERL